LHGVALSPGVSFANPGDDYSYATSFPQPILMSAAFDDDLIYDVATVISTEARAFSNGNRSGLNFWTPVCTFRLSFFQFHEFQSRF
jgi:beta-D-xylosidase 4